MRAAKYERIEVGLEAPFDPGAQHLHGDGLPVCLGAMHFSTMYLRDRGRGDRRAELREHLAQRLGERGRNRGFRLGLRERRHPVLQRFQVARQCGPDDIGTRREELAELDVGRAEPRQRGGELDRRTGGARPLDQPRDLQPEPRGRGQLCRIGEPKHAFAREHEARAREAKEMRDRSDHKRQPECSATMPPLITRCDTRAKPAARIMSANALGRGKRRIDSTR